MSGPGPQSAGALIELVADDGAFAPWDAEVVSRDPLSFVDRLAYPERLRAAAEASGESESVVAGLATVRGRRVVLIVGEFGFLAGTMGVASAERVMRALERAADLGAPVLAMPVSGGTRMQEGALSFARMAAVAAAVQRFRATGLTYLTYLRDPTIGGVLASWGGLGQVVLAQPGALLGFTGPRVVEQLTGRRPDERAHRAEPLRARGMVDDVVGPADLAARVDRVLRVAQDPPEAFGAEAPRAQLPPDARVDGWLAVERSRDADRPGLRQLLAACATDVTPLRGDGAGNDDTGCVAALARVCGVGVVVVGHDRPPGERGASLGASGYRKARRAMSLADELGLPLVAVIDTAGARVDEPEQVGLAVEIANCLSALSALSVPTLSVLLGEGSGGGAIALLPADRVVAAEHAWLAPISPEGASSILYRRTDRAAELARAQSISTTDLRAHGIVDVIVAEGAGEAAGGEAPSGVEGTLAEGVAATVGRELRTLLAEEPDARLRARQQRWRLPSP